MCSHGARRTEGGVVNCTNSLTVADVLRFGSFHAGHVRLDEALWNLGRGDSRRGRQDEALSDRVWVFVRERSDLSSQEGAEASDFLRLGEHHRDRPQQSLGGGGGPLFAHSRLSPPGSADCVSLDGNATGLNMEWLEAAWLPSRRLRSKCLSAGLSLGKHACDGEVQSEDQDAWIK